MTSLLNRIFTNIFPDFWNLFGAKRVREELEEEEENDIGVSPPKRLRVHSTTYAPKTLRESNQQPTVTTVRKRPSLSEKNQPVEYSFRRPITKTAQPPAFKWTEKFYVLDDDNENTMPKHFPNCPGIRKTRRTFTPEESIDLTDDEPRKNDSNIPLIDLTSDDRHPSGQKNSGLGNFARRNSRSLPSSFRAKNASLNLRTPRNNSRGQFRPNPTATPTEEVDLTQPASERRKSQTISSSSSHLQSYDLAGRISFGRLLGTFAADQKAPPPAKHSRPAEVVDLTKEETDEPSSSKSPGRCKSPESRRTPVVPKQRVMETKNAAVSSSTARDINKELLRVNSFEKKIKENKCSNELWLENFMKEYNSQCEEFTATKEKLERDAKLWAIENRKQVDALLEEKLIRHLRITESFIPDVSEEPYPPIIKPLPELTKEMNALINSVHSKNNRTVIIQKYAYTIRRADIETLFNLNWLNDEVISFYMVLIEKRNESMKDYPPIHVFNTFFYEALRNRGYDGVKRWTRKVNIFEKDIIIVPIHLQVHWCLLTVDLKKKAIHYYDSMGTSNNLCLEHMSNYLKAEHKTKMGSELDLTEWSKSNVKNIPQQMNGSDCGVFACTYAEYSARRAPFDFDQSKMQYFRRKMVYEIMTGQLL